MVDAPEDLPGFKSGVRNGDVIISVAGKTVETKVDFKESLHGALPGDHFEITAWREGKAVNITLFVGASGFAKDDVLFRRSIADVHDPAWKRRATGKINAFEQRENTKSPLK